MSRFIEDEFKRCTIQSEILFSHPNTFYRLSQIQCWDYKINENGSVDIVLHGCKVDSINPESLFHT